MTRWPAHTLTAEEVAEAVRTIGLRCSAEFDGERLTETVRVVGPTIRITRRGTKETVRHSTEWSPWVIDGEPIGRWWVQRLALEHARIASLGCRMREAA